MSEPKLISPMLDNFVMGDPISDRGGVRSCPAMDEISGKKYLVKIISSPATAAQLDALLLTGAYTDKDQALSYYREIAQGVTEEAEVLDKLSKLEGFMAFDKHQLVPMDDGSGYDVYLLGSYKMSLAKFLTKEPITHLNALNLGLDLCAALTVCRRCGYLYVNLKPENVYLTTDNGFRIGDLGFIKLESLRYASLPDRYRSEYTAPEITDAFATLTPTIDVYAVGLILYCVFNGGHLPNQETGSPLPPPDFADYEMAEIILKACDPDPEKRWEDPAQMGHALVDYMQRNGAHDTPIVPPVIPDQLQPEENNEITDAEDETDGESQPSDDTIYTENESGNLTFIPDNAEDETLPGMDEEDLDMEEVSSELTDILNQADDLLAHPIPEPVVVPEPGEITIPPVEEAPAETADEQQDDTEPTQESSAEDTQNENTENSAQEKNEIPDEETVEHESGIAENAEEQSEAEEYEDSEEAEKPKRHWIRYCVIAIALLAVLAAGYIVYKFYYQQNIASLTCEGINNELTVYVETDVEQDLLTVVCTDTYGNRLEAPVVNGTAYFSELAPDSPYTIKVEIRGFHTLTGETTATYATPKQTKIASFEAFVGNEAGTAVLHFTVEGPDAAQWLIKYSDSDENEATAIECADHTATIQGLTVGKEYTFELYPADDIYYVGTTTVTHTAGIPVAAEDLYVSSLKDGVMTVQWSTPKNIVIEEWTVRCTNDGSYNATEKTTEESFAFEGLTETGVYTIEVTAKGMMTGQRITVDTGAIVITDFTVSETEDHRTLLTWNCDDERVNGDWYVEYTIDGTIKHTVTGTEENSIVLSAMIPGARYKFTLGNGDKSFFGNVIVHTAAEAETFDAYGITSEEITLTMCYTPDYDEWNIYYLNDEDRSTSFRVGESASFAVTLETRYERSWDDVVTQVVIYNQDGRVIGVSTTENTWKYMWSYGEGALDLPSLPEQPGEYKAVVYFNGAFAAEQTFTVI